jgi:signal transduction histidine kinase
LQIQFSRQVTVAAHRLAAQARQHGLSALQLEINELLSDQTDIDAEMYLLTDPQGKKLAGNLDLFPLPAPTRAVPGPVSLPVPRDGVQTPGLLWVQQLDDGSMLVVGRDTHDLKEIKTVIGQASLAATLVALLLVLAGTSLFRRALRLRVEAIRETAVHVGTGELTRRIPAASHDDEFALLRNDINHMLDRIEILMSGVRDVSDSVAHNVRTPLTRVLAKLDKAKNSTDQHAVSQAIDSATAEIMDLISVSEKLLLIAEAESGVRRQTFQAVRLDRVVDDVVELFEAFADENGVVLEHLHENESSLEQAAWVVADMDLLAGVIVNLVENALKYAGAGARITIKTAQRNANALLTVSDNGPGVPDKHFTHLGSRFYRVSQDKPGFGLGLASVRAIVSLHEGTISFRNAMPGFRVDIELPLTKTP